MSTILDALRKVEEEKRTQETDVRTRLLSRSPRFDFRTPRRSHLPWVVGGGLMFVGILCGAGLMFWHSSDTSSGVDVASPPTSVSQVAGTQSQPVTPPGAQLQKQTQPEPQTQNTQGQPQGNAPTAAAVTLPKESVPVVPDPVVSSPMPATPPVIAETTPQHNPWGNLQKAAADAIRQQGAETLPRPSEGVVQRSPFVNSPSYDQIVAPPPLPSPSERRVTTAAPKPVRPRPQASEKSGLTPPHSPVAASALPPSSSAPASEREQSPSAPPGASLSFLQWSSDPEKRVASIKVGTGPATIAHEGDSIEGMTVVKIRPDAVELRSGESHYLLKAR